MNLKISIITVCYNSEETIRDTILSVQAQNYENIEHIIIDGASSDRTLDIIRQFKSPETVIVSEPDMGLYDAMNKGLDYASGDVVGFLNSDDFYPNKNVIKKIVKEFEYNVDVVFGNVVHTDKNDTTKIRRKIALKNFKPLSMRFGWMPPHPATFLRKGVVERIGKFDQSYVSAADYDYFIRVFLVQKFDFKYTDFTVAIMRQGGLTTSGWKSYIRTGQEMRRAIRLNGLYTNSFILFLRLPVKFFLERLITK